MTKIEAFIPHLYAAATGPGGLAAALPGLAAAVGGHQASFWMAEDGGVTEHASTLDADAAEFHAPPLQGLTPWTVVCGERFRATHSGAGAAAGGITPGAPVPPGARRAVAKPFATCAGAHGRLHRMGAVVPLGNGVPGGLLTLAVYRPREVQAFREAERRRMNALLPHLQPAAQLQHRLGGLERWARAGLAALDVLPFGVLVVGGGGEIFYANARAAVLARYLGFRLQGSGGIGALSVSRMEDNPSSRRLLRAVIAGGGSKLLNFRAPGHPTLAVLVSPLPPHIYDTPGTGRPRALVLFREPACQAAFSRRAFAHGYGLTPAEAEVAAELAAGLEPAAVAERRGVCLTTVRCQIDAVLKKADCNSLRELTRLLAGWEAVTPEEGGMRVAPGIPRLGCAVTPRRPPPGTPRSAPPAAR